MDLWGLGVSEGIGIGKAVFIKEEKFDTAKLSADPNKETIRFADALTALAEELESKADIAGQEQSEILQSHIILLNDPFIKEEIIKLIRAEECNCEYSVETILNQYIDMFCQSGDTLLEARAVDLKDIKTGLLAKLSNTLMIDVSTLPSGTVLAAEELTTSIAAGINPENITAIVTKEGGATSHMAIIARSVGIPAVVGILPQDIKNDVTVIVDGNTGKIVVSPSKEELEAYETKRAKLLAKKRELEAYRGKQSITKDNNKIYLFANVGLPMDIDQAVKSDAEGIGLFRTEFLFMNRSVEPTEQEQFTAYKKAAESFDEGGVIIRTLDVGGDKEIPYLEMEKEENPFLGWRAIRYCLDRTQIFETQIKAVLRASAFGCVKIMLPMISTAAELYRAKAIIESVKRQLDVEKIAYDRDIEVGIMVETPAAAVMADLLADEADFFSIGTNDLTQYTMAVDRGNSKVAHLYSACDPAILRLIYHIAQSAKKHNIMCGVCGEAAADTRLAKFFLGCGVGELSMSAGKVLQIREVICSADTEELKKQIDTRLPALVTVEQAEEFLAGL